MKSKIDNANLCHYQKRLIIVISLWTVEMGKFKFIVPKVLRCYFQLSFKIFVKILRVFKTCNVAIS